MRRHLQRNARLTEILPRYVPSGDVLDCGTGSGDLAHRLVGMGYRVSAVDYDPALCEYDDVDVQQCDIMQGLPFADESFDALMFTEVIEHMEDPYKAMRELNRVLRPGGVLVLTTPNYGHIETRLNFLVGATMPGAFDCPLEPPLAGRAHPHISPFSLVRLHYLLATSGFEVQEVTTCIPKRRALLLAPLAGLIWLYVRLLWSADRRRKYHIDEQMKVILGGRGLITVSRKLLGPADAPPG